MNVELLKARLAQLETAASQVAAEHNSIIGAKREVEYMIKMLEEQNSSLAVDSNQHVESLSGELIEKDDAVAITCSL